MAERLTASTITDDQIRELMAEAGRAGDDEQVRLCKRALNETLVSSAFAVARQACANAINRARAMEEGS